MKSNNTLNLIYYDTQSPGSFGGVARLKNTSRTKSKTFKDGKLFRMHTHNTNQHVKKFLVEGPQFME